MSAPPPPDLLRTGEPQPRTVRRAGVPLTLYFLRPFLLPLLLLLLVGLSVLYGVNRYEGSRVTLSDSQSRMMLLQNVTSDIATLENSERGYLITGSDADLLDFQLAQDALTANVLALSDLSVTTAQRQSAARLQQLVNLWNEQVAQPEMQARRTSSAAAATLASANADRDLLEQARDLLKGQLLEENTRLSDAGKDSAQTLNSVRLLTISGLLLGSALLLLTALNSARTVARSVTQLTGNAREIAAGQYHLRLPSTPVQELADLSGQFNAMTAAVQERERALQNTNEQLERSNRELEQFAYIASHDLQEPLRTIGSYTELLVRRYRGQLDGRAEQYMSFITQATTRMKELIQDLLAFSRVRQGGRNFTLLDTQALLQSVLDDLQVQIQSTGGRVEVPAPLPRAYGSGELLRHVLQNLIGNALKFHDPQRPPVVRVSATRSAPGQPEAWVFHVQDNGIGIEEQYHEKIFGVFQRLHSMEEYAGSGIGLAVTRTAIEQHGGQLWLDSVPGVGSTFHFSLPDQPPTSALPDSPTPPATTSPAPAEAPASGSLGERLETH